MASCPRSAYARIEPVLANFGRLFFVGEKPGLAQVVKLGNNMLAAAAVVLSAEALAMGVKADIHPQVMIDIINVSRVRHSALQEQLPQAVLPAPFDFGFTTALY